MKRLQKLKPIILTIASLMLALLPAFTGACRKQTSPGQRYEIRGRIVSVDKTNHTATISHEDIKDYMPAMTMEFRIKDDWALAELAPGDRLAGVLVVDGLSHQIEEPVITKAPVVDPNAKPESRSEAGPGAPVPDFALINQDGKKIHLGQYRGRTLLITFIYTRCPRPDYCALMSNNFHEIDGELRRQPELYKQTHLLSVTVDPEYDTPKVLRSYGAAHTERYQDEKFDHWEFAGGDPDKVKAMAQFFGMDYFRNAESGNDEVIHSLRTAVIDPEGKLYKLYRGNEWKPKEVLDDLKSMTPGPKH